MILNRFLTLKVLLFIFYTTVVVSQRDHQNYNQLFDQYIGPENKGINNGYSFNSQIRIADDSHIFFKDYSFLEASIVFNNQTYNTKIKYDIYEDQVIVKYINQLNNFSILLDTEMIDEFQIANHNFIVLKNEPKLKKVDGNGIFEEIFKGQSFQLLEKHFKLRHEILKGNIIEYYFTKNSSYFFKYKGNYHPITSKKSIIKVLPDYKKIIKKHYKNAEVIDDLFLQRLFQHLDRLEN